MTRFQAHVTDEWETDTMVIQVRQLATNDTTQAIAYMAEDTDGMATLAWHQIDPRNYEGREHLVPTPGVRIRHDVAVAMARAILTDAGKDADEVERLKAEVADLEGDKAVLLRDCDTLTSQRDQARREVEMLELLVEAKDAHLEREARTSDHFHESLEHERREQRHDQGRRHHPARRVTVTRADLGLDED
jgi:hypothetical protein